MPRLFRPWHRALTFLLVSACSLQTYASTVLEMSFQDVLDHAELVFEGRVSAVESRQEDDGMIHTFVRFEVLDVLKGDTPDTVLELRFLGGTVGTQRLEITDMIMPEVGESGVYFVESLHVPQVNPLVGWAQGHFLIEPQGGGERGMLTAHHEPVLAACTDKDS